MKTLLIVDPQIDFISGSLAVPKAEEAMLHLTEKIKSETLSPSKTWEHIVITVDAHPIDHCSFSAQGGEWPPHCIKQSVGAAIYEPLMQALVQLKSSPNAPRITVVEKGKLQEKDEYSAFGETLPDYLQSASSIEVCGIAGEYCVFTTLSDLIKHGIAPKKITILKECIGSFDNGETMEKFAQTHQCNIA
ncbi:MAG: isochorismatase family protein [Porphyromonas sp.]|nr:isochorismatase family protein [Porphyromonas sp.]